MQMIHLPTYLWLSLTQRPGFMDTLEEATCGASGDSLLSQVTTPSLSGIGIGSALNFPAPFHSAAPIAFISETKCLEVR